MKTKLFFLSTQFFFYLAIPVLTFGQVCNQSKEDEVNYYNIIPYPVELIPKNGRFEINKETGIHFENKEIEKVAEFLKNDIEKKFDLRLECKHVNETRNIIFFSYDTTISHQEGYTLKITKDYISIRFNSPSGAFYAVQTIRQLLPYEQVVNQAGNVPVPAVYISDYPLLPYRGYMLDVARHFFPVSFIKKMIDASAFYKLNVLQLHLTDDQGWRIEIKKYPRLHEIGAWRAETQKGHRTDTPLIFDGIRHGGYYTQDELREIVSYAEERFIRIIPEIDIPGHAQAILAAYPQFGCVKDTLYNVSTIWGVHDNILCPYEETYEFLEDVFDEIIGIFTDEYIHIGGDEVVKRRWQESEYCQELIIKLDLHDEDGLQSYFINRVENYLNSRGRQIIGWDEILEGGLAPNATVMSWRGERGGIEAAKQRHNVVMTPSRYMYLNFYNTMYKMELEPLANTVALPLKKVYDYHVFPESLTEEKKQYIIGLQACLWTEYVNTGDLAESLTFPRLCAMAEVAWMPPNLKNYDSFNKRLISNVKHLKNMDIKYSTLFLDEKNNEY